jgi:hypothetical protein
MIVLTGMRRRDHDSEDVEKFPLSLPLIRSGKSTLPG